VITLAAFSDYLVVFLLAAGAGLVGGLAAELLLNRNGETGAFEMPARKGPLFDLGGFASLFVGAVVGIAILVVFPPDVTVVNNAAAASTSFRSYDVIRLIATCLVAGSAGGAVLTALQARVVAAINESRVQWTLDASQQQMRQLADRAKREAADAVRSVAGVAGGATGRSRTPPGAMGTPPIAPPASRVDTDEAISRINAEIDRSAEEAQAAIAAAARSPRDRL
jgi:hypothetical protein